jgi:ABC-type Fe3+-siderophore transport system permease subunit
MSIFAIGMVGAIAPEILRLYTIRTKPDELRWSPFYFGISLLFAALGGVVAIILPATTAWGAFYAGISAPVLINNAAKRATQDQSRTLKSAPRPARGFVRSFIEGL